MVPFRGTFEHTLDAKNRLTVPVKYRPALEHGGALLAMPLDQKPCVSIWLPSEYDAYTQRAIEELPPLSPKRSELERFFYGNSKLTDDAAPAVDAQRYFEAFPDLKAHALDILTAETRMNPGEKISGTVVVSFPVKADVFAARKSLTVTVAPYDELPVVMRK